jgi:4-hydroxy-tetrahydrodipicolinate reductase
MPTPPDHDRKLRVVQWATGNVGSRALRHVIRHPDLELVGVWVHGAEKVGRDAGTLAGLDPVGILATHDSAEILALNADCVLYMPHVFDVAELCRILTSGANVVSTRMELQNPDTLAPADRAAIEAACAAGNSSVHATGASPGFITEALPIVLASIQRRLDCLTIYEFADSASRNSPEMLFGMMGFGARPEDGPNAHILEHMRMSFSGTIALIAKALGLPVDEITAQGALGIARKDVHIPAGIVPQGTVAATRSTISGIRGGKPVIRFIANWYVSSDVDTTDGQDWEFRESGWRVVVEGDCPLDIGITFPVAEADYAEMTPGLTANRPVNAIPYVCAAPPGFQTIIDLPQIIARLG